MKQTVNSIKSPAAYVSTGKNRLPKGSQVYLKNGQEFEIELFNPMTETILAQISLNGNTIGGGGIVLRPGEHVFIERFLDKESKFKFETYEVESNNLDVKFAIANNGKVKVEFYKEYIPMTTYQINGNWNGYQNGIWNNYHTGTFDLRNIGNTCTSNDVTFTNCSNTSSFNFLNEESLNDNSKSFKSNSKSLKSLNFEETGRIEEGSKSNQKFEYVNKTFNTYSFYTAEYQILPFSKKPIEVNEIKVYCTSCGTKQKKTSWKHCPSCGNKF